ncbi:MAG: ASCH domain-containing protein [Opitutaceae bacterium]
MNAAALLLSIKPRFADAIFSGEKTVEIRRVRPRLRAGDLVFVYVSSPRCALEGAFEVERLLEAEPKQLWKFVAGRAGLPHKEFDDYLSGCEIAFGIVIRRRWQLAEPLHLKKMRKRRVDPPQSYRYLLPKHQAALFRGVETAG